MINVSAADADAAALAREPGYAIAVIRGAEVVVQVSGYADLEAAGAITPKTRFRLASVTKPFLAEAAAILSRRGVLSYDQPMDHWPGVTVRHLLTHTSGLPDYEDLIPPSRVAPVSDEDVEAIVRERGVVSFAPGTRWSYSNTGYVLLGLLIERASGMALGDFLRREIFEKSGMHGTMLGLPASERAYGYARTGERWVRRDQSVTSSTRGDGGIYSCVADLARWVRMLGPQTETVATDDSRTRYGLGWFVTGDRIWHHGETVGFRTAIVRTRDGTAIVLTNRDEGNAVEMALRFLGDA